MTSQTPLLTPVETASAVVDSMCKKLEKHPVQTFLLAIFAGMFIAMGFMFYGIVTTGSENMAWGAAKLVGAFSFTMGLILVIFLGGELFTSTVMTSLAVLTGRFTVGQMLKNWLLVYSGNFLGALIFSALVLNSGYISGNNYQVALNVMKIGAHKLHHPLLQAIVLGVLCNMLVCIAVWISFAGRTAMDKIFLMMMPVMAFVAAGFEHSVANMYMLPTAIGTGQMLSPQQWNTLGVAASEFADLTWTHFIVNNLIPVTLGNIIGGSLIALSFWFILISKPFAKNAQPRSSDNQKAQTVS